MSGASGRRYRSGAPRKGPVGEMLPLLVGYVAQQMKATPTFALVADYWGDDRDAACVGRALGDHLVWFFAALDEHYANRAHAVATVELSMRREPNVHVLIRGVNLKEDFVRENWRDRTARTVNLEEVEYPLGMACYIFKIPLLGLVAPPAARDEILAFARDLNGGYFGYRHGSFIDPELVHQFKDWRSGVLDRAARRREDWIGTKMPYDVTDALRRATPPDDAVVDDLFKDISF